VAYHARQPVSDVTFGFILYRSTDQLIVYEGNFPGGDLGMASIASGTRVEVDFAFRANLTRGQYHVECYTLHNPTHEYLSRLSPAALITVDEDRTCRGVANLDLGASVVHGPVHPCEAALLFS
jgi:hypothetical protein